MDWVKSFSVYLINKTIDAVLNSDPYVTGVALKRKKKNLKKNPCSLTGKTSIKNGLKSVMIGKTTRHYVNT